MTKIKQTQKRNNKNLRQKVKSLRKKKNLINILYLKKKLEEERKKHAVIKLEVGVQLKNAKEKKQSFKKKKQSFKKKKHCLKDCY